MSKWDKFEHFVRSLSKLLYWIAGIGMFALLLVSVIDISGNKFFKYPLPGGIDIVSYIAVVAIAFGIAEVQLSRGHIEVEMFEQRLGKFQRRIVNIFVNVLGMMLWTIVAWRSFLYGTDLLKAGEVSMTLEMPIYPFVYMVGICAIVTVLVILVQTVSVIRKVK